MWSLIAAAILFLKDSWKSFQTKPEPEKVPEPVDTKKATDLLNPKE